MHGIDILRRAVPALCAALLALPDAAGAATANPALNDFAFGNVASLNSDLTKSQSTCSFSGVTPMTYSVTASGTGGGAFTVTNGTSTVPYEVQWAQMANAASGANLTPNVALANQSGGGLLTGLTCALGLLNATAIVIVRATSLQAATAGSYSGTLTLILSSQ
jgi:hypothetical protein